MFILKAAAPSHCLPLDQFLEDLHFEKAWISNVKLSRTLVLPRWQIFPNNRITLARKLLTFPPRVWEPGAVGALDLFDRKSLHLWQEGATFVLFHCGLTRRWSEWRGRTPTRFLSSCYFALVTDEPQTLAELAQTTGWVERAVGRVEDGMQKSLMRLKHLQPLPTPCDRTENSGRGNEKSAGPNFAECL